MENDTTIKLLALCLLISVSCNIIGAIIVVDRHTQSEEENKEIEPINNDYTEFEQSETIPLNVDFDEDILYFIDNTEISFKFVIEFDYFSAGHEFHFSLNPDFYFLNISENILTIEKYFLNIIIKEGTLHCTIFENDEYFVNKYGIYPVQGNEGWCYTNRLLLEIKHIDEFIIDETFKLNWYESTSDDYLEHNTFTFRFLNLEKIRLLDWDIPDKYSISTDKNQLIKKWGDITTQYTNGWFYLPAILKHDTDPWRDYHVELWYHPTTYETVIKEVEL